MADFLVTVDGKYLYYGLIRKLSYLKYLPHIFGPLDNVLNNIDSLEKIQKYLNEKFPDLNLGDLFEPNNFDYIFKEKTGRVTVAGNYMAQYASKTKKHTGYANIQEFWDSATISKTTNNFSVSAGLSKDIRYIIKSGLITPRIDKIDPKDGDRIILAKRWIEQIDGEYKIQIGIKTFTYDPDYELTKDGLDYKVINGVDKSEQIYSKNNIIKNFPGFQDEIIYEEEIIEIEPDKKYLRNYLQKVKEKKFLRPSGKISALTQFQVDMVENIVMVFDQLFRLSGFVSKLEKHGFKHIFIKHFELIHYYGAKNAAELEKYHQTFNASYFDLLRVRLNEFFFWARSGLLLAASKTNLLSRIFGLFNTVTLKHLKYLEKLDLLKVMLHRNIWVSGRWLPSTSNYKLTEEEVLVKIVKSIAVEDEHGNLNYVHINLFMDALNSPPFYEASTNNKTLFQILYDRINDQVFFGDDGKGPRGQLVNEIYLLWFNSKYNPNSDHPANIANSVEYKYLPNNLEDGYLPNDTPINDTSPSPFLINYESQKYLFWYKDNFLFRFEENKIKALIYDPKVTRAEFFPAEWFDEDVDHSLFGYYDVFQPIAIKNSNSLDTIIRIPIGSEINPCEVNESNNNNSIPIFYLKYIDDLGDYSDTKEKVGIVADVLLTFTGIGNITKARHLLKISVLRRYLTGKAISEAAKQALMRSLRIVGFAKWEVFIGVFSSVHALTTAGCQKYADDPCNPPKQGTPEYKEYESCQTVQNWLLAIELLTFSGDLLAKRFVKRASKKLYNKLPENFPRNKKKVIGDLADIDIEYNKFLNFLEDEGYSIIKDKIEKFTEDKRFAFFFDFQNDIHKLQLLKNNPDLMDAWNGFTIHQHLRKEFRYLDSFKRLSSDAHSHEIDHITKVVNKSTGTGFQPGAGHSYENIRNGDILDPDTQGLPDDMKSTLVSPPVNGHKNYDVLWYKYFDDIDVPADAPTNNIKQFNGVWYKKKSANKNTIWNKDWDNQRIKEEMVFLWANKDIQRLGRATGKRIDGVQQYKAIYTSTLTDGTPVKITVMNIYEQFNKTHRDGILILKLMID